jgi:nitrogen regulatory protein A
VVFQGIPLLTFMFTRFKMKESYIVACLFRECSKGGVSLMEDDLRINSHLEQLVGHLSSDLAAIALIDQNNRIKWEYMYGNINERYRSMVKKPGVGITGQVVRFGRMIIIDQQHPITDQMRTQYPIMISEQLACVAALPLGNDQRIFGVLLIGDRQLRAYCNEEIEHLNQARLMLAPILAEEYSHISK